MYTLHNIHRNYYFHRDSNMKVEVVMKYLADKLGLARPHQVHWESTATSHLFLFSPSRIYFFQILIVNVVNFLTIHLI
jgi:hypothetical protein